MRNFFKSLRSMAKKPKEAPTKSGNRRLNDSEMKAQRQQSAERKEREAARLKAQKTVNPNAPRNRPNHRASSEKQAPKKSKWLSPFRRTMDAKKREQRRQKNSIAPLVRDLLSGEFLTREGVTRHIPISSSSAACSSHTSPWGTSSRTWNAPKFRTKGSCRN